jgi:hydroxypyruvate reductase/glycerate 2-kinase
MLQTAKIASGIFNVALKAVDPYQCVLNFIPRIQTAYENGNFKKLFLIAFGKAACAMTSAVEEKMDALIDAGVVITKYGHCARHKIKRQTIAVFEAAHPVPDENGVKAAQKAIALAQNADEQTLIICLISGGGSALLVSPFEGITLKEKQAATNLLLRSGADINELNTVRKHISSVKGGRFAETAYPAKVISLILSDVIGDRLDVIASGPTSPDTTTFSDAVRIIEKYGLKEKCPENIMGMLLKGTNDLIKETPKKNSHIFKNIENIIIGNNLMALEAAKTKAVSLGLQTEIMSSEITGEAREIGKRLADIALKHSLNRLNGLNSLNCLISGGETTVTVKGNGKGGRNMELALAFAMEIEGIEGITLLSAGTDGTDGPTDAAGAIVDGETVKKARAIGINPLEYLNNNNSYNFFKRIDGLFITGPTGTNVMDMQIVVIP